MSVSGSDRLRAHRRSLRAVQTLLPVTIDLEFVGWVPARDPRAVERALHRRFAADRVRGTRARELFTRTPNGELDRWLTSELGVRPR